MRSSSTRLLVALASVALLLVVPAAASAGTLSLVDGTLSYDAHPGERDELTISLSPFDVSYRTEDREWVRIEFGPGMTHATGAGIEACGVVVDDSTEVACPLELVQRVVVDTKDREDAVSSQMCTNRFADGSKCNRSQYSHVPTITARLGGANDSFRGGAEILGADQAQAGATVFGGAGNDTIIGTSAADALWGEAGNDAISGYGGSDVVRGGIGNDTVAGVHVCGFSFCSATAYFGAGAADVVYGDAGNDNVWGGLGMDQLSGGPGIDRVWYAHDRKRDVIDGGPGVDSLIGVDFSRRTYRFSDAIRNLERVTDERSPPQFEWKCAANRCTVTRLNYRPATTVIVIVL